jgi:putative transcriptional regulator
MTSKPSFSLKAGGFLVSEPYLQDPQFFRSVVVLVEHNEQGTIGFVVNKPLPEVPLSELIDVPEGMELPVFLGGPVQQDTIFFLHHLGLGLLPKSIEVTPDLWWSSDFSRLFELIEQGFAEKNQVKVLLGYSGWRVGQLREECENESWVIANVPTTFVFEEGVEHLWKTVLKTLGGTFSELSRYPIDPNLN